MTLRIGTFRDDDLTGTEASELILGLAGDDSLIGNSGDDTILGDGGDDTIRGGTTGLVETPALAPEEDGDNLILAGAGNDSIVAGHGADTVHGEGGDDSIQGWGSPSGTSAASLGFAQTIDSADLIFGGAGDDTIGGGGGGDVIFGGAGDDVIRGGTGADTVFGGPGADTFVFGYAFAVFGAEVGAGEGNRDVVMDFKAGVDSLDIQLIGARTLVYEGDNTILQIASPVSGLVNHEIEFRGVHLTDAVVA
jgi:Ca2+-binding RTX toxin-like protein